MEVRETNKVPDEGASIADCLRRDGMCDWLLQYICGERLTFNSIWLVEHVKFTSVDFKSDFNFSNFLIFLFVTKTRQVTNHFELLFGTGNMKSDDVTFLA